MITIPPSPNADSRTATGEISKVQLAVSTAQHRIDVFNVLSLLGDMLMVAASTHDHTKLSGMDDFYESCVKSSKDKSYDFTKGEWYQNHINTERHHLLARCPEDVNLIDVLEYMVDYMVAGLGRTGEAKMPPIGDDVLRKAYENTVLLIQNNVTTKPDNGMESVIDL